MWSCKLSCIMRGIGGWLVKACRLLCVIASSGAAEAALVVLSLNAMLPGNLLLD